MGTYLSSSSLSVVSSSSVVAYRVSLPPASRPTWSGTTAPKLLVYFIFYMTNFPMFFVIIALLWETRYFKDFFRRRVCGLKFRLTINAWLLILYGWCYEYLLSIEPFTVCQLASMATTGSLINFDVQRYPQTGMDMK